ncbi:MAG: DUF6207 family protein [Streptomyces sp.]|uniref:DUF6207 family protein n=1 Tax=Streptomyces sp. TaxID=1931 RepID=UPI003D6C38CA
MNEIHLREPGLIVVDLAAVDNRTAFAFQQVLASRWATATADRTTLDPDHAWCPAALLPGPAPGHRRRMTLAPAVPG